MVENNLENRVRQTLLDADAILMRSGMSIKRKQLALKLLKDAKSLRQLRMVNTRKRNVKKRQIKFGLK